MMPAICGDNGKQLQSYPGTPERQAKILRMLERRQPTLTIILENVHDPHNVSAVIRSCDAVGVLDVHLVYTGGQQFPELGERSSASARKWVRLVKHRSISECYAALRAKGMQIISTCLGRPAVSLYALDMTRPVAIAFGNEHSGLSEEACQGADVNMVIPQMGMVQSLNISVACAVTLFEAMRQRLQQGMYDVPQLSPAELDALLTYFLAL
ncbi:MAG: TrmH family RNA methyltransferase [Bacteroidota bacterium]|nr:TrmH family RNA methyltransferase [Bacteroidota bacterium]